MGDVSSGTQQSVRQPEDRLDSWKEIAAYLSRDVTTVQRWEKREGMPVHRHVHDRMGSVYAFRTELDAWSRSRKLPTRENGNVVAPSAVAAPPGFSISRSKWRFFWPAALVLVALSIGSGIWLEKTEYFWRNPLADAHFQLLTDFPGAQHSAAVSRDGRFVAFLSDRDGPTDVWITQVGSGQFHNLTHGIAGDVVNPELRGLGFSPDGALVTYWRRTGNEADAHKIGVWAVPILGGEPRPYLEDVAEYDWSRDGSRLVYHTPEPGDPMFVSEGGLRSGARPIFAAPAGLHSHFPLWDSDSAFIYFVHGTLPDKLDIWRVRRSGGTPERVTSHNGQVSYPVLLGRRTLMYLASDPDGSGPWLYSMDVERRIPHRLTFGLDRYTSLAASADGHRLVASLAAPKRSLWRLRIADGSQEPSAPAQITLQSSNAFSPRFGSDYLLYVSAGSTSDSIWKLVGGTATQLWNAEAARVVGGPAVSPDGRLVAFSVREDNRTRLCVVHVDGTNLRVVSDSLQLRGAPAWMPNGQSVTSAADDHGTTRLFQIPIDGKSPVAFVREYSLDPAWAPDGSFLIYSGPDVGTTFSVKAVNPDGSPHRFPNLTLTRGARHLILVPRGNKLVFLRGELRHKDLWTVDLATGTERQLTNFTPNFDVRDFDISSDGREVVLEREQEHSDVLLLDLARRHID
jgi:Tol biopolymer transport system component